MNLLLSEQNLSPTSSDNRGSNCTIDIINTHIKYFVSLLHRSDASSILNYLFISVLGHFQHCTGHITMGSWKGSGNQYIQLVKVLYCKLPTNGKQLPAFPLEAVPGTEPRPQR